MTIQHRVIPCLKHHVSNLFRKSLRYRLRNPVYKKNSKPSKTMVKVRSIWEIIRSSDNPRVINEDQRDLAHDELLMDEEEEAGLVFDELMKEETNRVIHDIQETKQ